MNDFALPSSALQTYTLRRPLGGDFWRKATCEEYGCENWRNGWVTRLPYDHELVRFLLAGKHGRTFHETTGLKTPEREFTFPPGQQCFQSSEHKVPTEREAIGIVRPGLAAPRRHTRLVDWRDDMQEHLGRVAEDRQRG